MFSHKGAFCWKVHRQKTMCVKGKRNSISSSFYAEILQKQKLIVKSHTSGQIQYLHINMCLSNLYLALLRNKEGAGSKLDCCGTKRRQLLSTSCSEGIWWEYLFPDSTRLPISLEYPAQRHSSFPFPDPLPAAL